jgi:drug/metabolite transporter (DMT)-like permease
MALSMALWVALETFGAFMMRGTSIPQVVWLRYAFHLLLMLVLLGPRYGLGFVRTSRPVLHIVRSLLMFVMPISFWLGVQVFRPADVMGVFWVVALLVLVSTPLGRGRLTVRVWAAMLLGCLGILAIYRPHLHSMGRVALVWPVAMAVSFSLYVVLTKILDRTESVLTNLFWSAISVFAVLSLSLPAFWQPVGTRAIVGAIGIASLGLVSLAALDLSIRRGSPAGIAPLLLLQPVFEWLVRVLAAGRGPAFVDTSGVVVTICVIGFVIWHEQWGGRQRGDREAMSLATVEAGSLRRREDSAV